MFVFLKALPQCSAPFGDRPGDLGDHRRHPSPGSPADAGIVSPLNRPVSMGCLPKQWPHYTTQIDFHPEPPYRLRGLFPAGQIEWPTRAEWPPVCTAGRTSRSFAPWFLQSEHDQYRLLCPLSRRKPSARNQAKACEGRTIRMHTFDCVLQDTLGFLPDPAIRPYRQARRAASHRPGHLEILGVRQAHPFRRRNTLLHSPTAAAVAGLPAV